LHRRRLDVRSADQLAVEVAVVTNRDVLSLALKVLGVYFVVHAAVSLGMLVGTLWALIEQGPGAPVWALVNSGIVVGVYVLAACLLVSGGDAVAARLIPQPLPMPTIAEPGWERKVLSVGARICGILTFVAAARPLGTALGRVLTWQGPARIPDLGDLVTPLVMIAGGIYLLFGARHLVDWACRRGGEASRQSGDAA